MKLAIIIATILTALFMLSTLICGLWMKANNVTEISSIKFHMVIGVISTILFVVTMILVFIRLK